MGYGSNGSPKLTITWVMGQHTAMTHQRFYHVIQWRSKRYWLFCNSVRPISDRIKNTTINWNLVGLHTNIFDNIFSYRCVMCTTKNLWCSVVSTGGEGGRVPLEVGEEGTPMSLPFIFHSTIVVDIPLGRYEAIEYSATFDDITPT
jgi:hypothetical protein